MKRSTVFNLSKIVLLTCAALIASSAVHAAEVMPSFAGAPSGWATDRYQPTVFADVGAFQGRNSVLQIGITSAENVANRGNNSPGEAYLKGSFYNTQGKAKAVVGGAGDTLSADLYIPAAWSNPSNGNVRTDMWGIMVDVAGANPRTDDYPIIGFTNYGGAARLRAFDSNAGLWTDLTSPINYDGWNALSVKFTGTAFEYSVNGSLVFTDTDLLATGAAKFGSTIMQAYNFGDPTLTGVSSTADYSVQWSNAAAVPEPEALSLAVIGILMAGLFGTRRRKG